jgi:LPS sulfotransferase NodH
MQSSNQRSIYIVLGCGRTGSNWICKLLQKSLQNDINPITKLNKNNIYHSHNKNIVVDMNLDPQKVVLIVSKRKDLFANVMSHLTAEITQEWHGYTDKKIVPKYVNPDVFKRVVVKKKLWYEDIDLQLPYKRIATVYYEDLLIDGQKHIMEKLGIENYNVIHNSVMQSITFGVIKPSPYNYKDCIANWEELYNIYMLS